MRLKYVLSLLLITLLISLLYLTKAEPFYSFSLRFNDTNFFFQQHEASDEIVFIHIDEQSVNRFGQWPWKRDVLAQGVHNLPEDTLLILDMVFSEPTDEDEIFAQALDEQGNNICGFFLRNTTGASLSPQQWNILHDSSLDRLAAQIEGKTVFVGAQAVEANVASILSACTLSASFSTLRDKDHLFRQYPIAFSVHNEVFPSIGIQSLRLFFNKDITQADNKRYSLAGHTFYSDEKGFTQLNFYPEKSFQHYSFESLYDARIPVEKLRDKIIIFGITETGVGDMRATPVGMLAGPLIHATFISNVLQDILLRKVMLVDSVMILFFLLLPLIWIWIPSIFKRVTLYLGVYALFFIATKLAYMYGHLYIDSFYPLVALGLSAISSEVLLHQKQEMESRFIQGAFASYLSPVLLQKLMKEPQRLGLGGEKKELSIFFSDIRSFTSISESMDPQKLTQYLNRYFTPMSDIIMKHEGMIDKYIGDAVMAFYNAPLDVTEHARKACEASLEMLDSLEKLNQEFVAEGLPPLDIGIGLNTAEVVVGNMGSNKRFNYTVIGDGVNLASRVEGINKNYGTRILITEFTYAHVKDFFLTRPIEKVKVKGKEEEVLLYELLKDTPGNQNKTNLYLKARNLYFEGKIDEAKENFEAIEDDVLAQYFLIKIEDEKRRGM